MMRWMSSVQRASRAARRRLSGTFVVDAALEAEEEGEEDVEGSWS